MSNYSNPLSSVRDQVFNNINSSFEQVERSHKYYQAIRNLEEEEKRERMRQEERIRQERENREAALNEKIGQINSMFDLKQPPSSVVDK